MDPKGEVIRNLFRLQQLANGLTGPARAIVDELIADTIADLARFDPTAVQVRYRAGRIKKILERLRERSAEAYGEIRKRTRQTLAGIGRMQADWAAESLLGQITAEGVTAVNVTAQGLGVNFFKAIIDTDPFEGHTLSEWLNMADESLQRRVRRELNRGLVNGDTMPQLTRRLRATVLPRSRREVETVARTATNFLANRAHLETYSRNSDVTQRYRYTSVLDGRTSDICRALDGREFKYGAGPVPPQHPNCRSVVVPIVDWAQFGIEGPGEGTRASRDGPVRAGLDYEGWLRQDEARAREILGPSRFDLFWNKGVSLRDMVRNDGTSLTLQELGA